MTGLHSLPSHSTVFQTFDTSLDRWTQKIGIFGRSFHDLGAAIRDAHALAAGNSGDNAGFFQNLKNNLSSPQYGGMDWKKNTDEEIITRENIDSYIPELTADAAKEKLGDMITWQKTIKKDRKKNWQDYYKTLGDGEDYITDLIKNTDDLSKLTGDDLVKANRAARASVIEHNEALKSQTLSARAGQTALKALSTAGNMLLFTAVTEGIQLAINAVNNWIHADEIALEKAEAAQSRIDEINSSIKSRREDAGRLGTAYDRLSGGVDTSTNANLTLSAADYNAYLDTANQLAETFPTLRAGIDENGNALLSLGQNGRTASEDLEKLLKAEAELDNYEISKNLDDLFAGVSVKIKDAEEEVTINGKSIEVLETQKRLMEGGFDFSEGFRISGDMSDSTDSAYYNAFYSAFQNTYNALDADRQTQLADVLDPAALMAVDSRGVFDFYLSSYLLTPEEQKLLENQIQLQTGHTAELIGEQIKNANMEQASRQREAELAWKDFLPSLTAGMKSQATFQSLGEGDFGEEIQNFAAAFVSNLDVSVAGKWGKGGDAYKWVRDHFLLPLTELDESDRKSVVDAYSRLLELNPEDLSFQNQAGIDIFTSIIAAKLGLDSEEIRLNLGFKADEDLKSKYDEAIARGTEKFGGLGLGLQHIFTELGIDSTEEIDFWNEVTANAKNAAEAIEMYKNAKKADAPTFTEAWSALDNTEDGSQSSLKNELLSLAEAGQLTAEAFHNVEGSDSFLEQLGLDPEDTGEIQDVIDNINQLASSTDQLASMKKGMSGLSQNLYARQQDPGTAISAETFQGMDAGLKAQTKEWDNYVAVLGNASSSVDNVQAATDRLAAAYINSNNFLSNLTRANKDYYISQLQAMGVANAEEIVQESLAEKYDLNRLRTEALKYTKNGVTDATIAEINEFLMEQGATDGVTNAIMAAVEAERIFAASDLGTTAKISALEDLINTTYGAAAAIEFASLTGGYDDRGFKKNGEMSLEGAAEKIQNKYSLMKNITVGGYKGGSRRGSSGGSSSPAKTKTPEIFDFIETALSRIKSKIEDVKNAAKETFQSFQDRAKSYTDAISSIGKEIDIQEQARQKYLNKANEVGLEGTYIWQIQNGNINIESITDDGLKKRIRNYKEWYEKALACEKAVKDLKKEQKELAREQIELSVTKYDKRISRKDATKDQAQAKIDYKEARGISVSAKDYTGIKKTSVSQIKNYQAMNARIRELRNSVAKGSEAWAEYQARIDANNKSVLELKTRLFETAKAAAALAGQKAETRAAKKDAANEYLDAKIENKKTAKGKNVLIKSKIKNINKKKKDYRTAVDTDRKNVRTAGNQLKKFKKTPENKAVLKKIKKHVRNKEKIPDSVLKEVSSLKDGGELLKRCANYNAYMEALQKDRETAKLFAQTSKTEIANLDLERFSNISQEWDNSLYTNTQKETSLNSQLERNEAAGNKKENLKVYRSLMANEEDEQKKLREKRRLLQKRLNFSVSSGRVKEGSSQWLQMKQEIDEVSNAIDNSRQSLLDYQKAYNSLQWSLFDDAMEDLKRLNAEADYYIDRMADKELVDKENGGLTEYGTATLALHNDKYLSYLAQAEEYKKEYQKLMGQIQRKELNEADPEVKARLQELQDEMRDANLMADKELQAGKEILQNVYDKQLEKVSSLISKYKELMQTEKDAYEYQRTIEQKVKDLASLQKRLNAYAANDDTEENRARIQKIKLELAEAKEDLKDAQYDKYLSDTETMLDEIYEDMESFFDEKLDNTDAILEEISNLIGTDNKAIIDTLKSLDNNLSTTLEKLLKDPTKHSEYESNTVTDATKEDKDTGTKNNNKGSKNNTGKNNSKTKNAIQTLQEISGRSIRQTRVDNIRKSRLDTAHRLPTESPKDTRAQNMLQSTLPRTSDEKILQDTLSQTPAEDAKKLLAYDPSVLLRYDSHNLIPLLSSEISSVSNLLKATERMQNINISLGGITMNGVNDPQTFAKQLREEVCKNGQTTKCITEAVISNAMGNGVGNAKFFQY